MVGPIAQLPRFKADKISRSGSPYWKSSAGLSINFFIYQTVHGSCFLSRKLPILNPSRARREAPCTK
jgi:hypothetical protein